MQKIILTTIIICVFTIAKSQDKATVKLEIAAGPGFTTGYSGNFFPKLLVPITKRFDIGVTFINAKYGDSFDASVTDFGYSITSLEFRYNLSNVHRKINPHIGYLLSLSSSKLSDYDKSIDGLGPALESKASKSDILHGLNVGLDVRLNSFVSLTTQLQLYSFSEVFISQITRHYDAAKDKFVFDSMSYGNQTYLIAGLQIKLFSQKSFIR